MLIPTVKALENQWKQEYMDKILDEVQEGIGKEERVISQSGIKSMQQNVLGAEKNGEAIGLSQLEAEFLLPPAMVVPFHDSAIGISIGMAKDFIRKKEWKKKVTPYYIKVTKYQRTICDLLEKTDTNNEERKEYLHSLEIILTALQSLIEVAIS